MEGAGQARHRYRVSVNTVQLRYKTFLRWSCRMRAGAPAPCWRDPGRICWYRYGPV